MIVAFDTHYFDNKAKTVGVSFQNWTDGEAVGIEEEIIEGIADYEPGSFFKRELPCILSILKRYNLDTLDCIIVDGYVHLDNDGKLGMGGYLYQNLEKNIPIIGVAKSWFRSNEINSRELLRGESKKPLFISAAGIDLTKAYELVRSMHGDYRMPTLLQLMDAKTKGR